ncbi:FadR/GntR family transcriptional regulator [Taibaiella koreensis]|uniref:FadR/GntR family transcriptional regulator n=1 Tax=Taibaiella koreensis TaxID=1268548 RepID=UPI000E59EF1B|nr:FadR/GntR family transcriptional regulator [Taibaiella koreensis]
MNKITLNRKSLAESVAEQLQVEIASGTFKVGTQLPTEPDLMLRFGVGRSSVREAIRILAHNGWVKVQQGLGTFVASRNGAGKPLTQYLEQASFDDVDEVRLVLEIRIAERAAAHRTMKDIARMKQCLNKRLAYAKAGDLEACMQADIDFHTALADASKNGIMIDLYQTIAIHLKKAFEQRHKDVGAFLESQERHEQLLQYITDQNAPKAVLTATRINQRK